MRVPFVVHLHSGGFQGWIESNSLHRTVARRLIDSASSTVVVAAHWQPLAEELGARLVHVIPHMLPANLAETLPGSRTNSAARSSTGERRLVVLYYGRWAPVKGLDLVADAIAKLGREHQQRLELRIFGNGDRAWTEQLFRNCGLADVRINGWLADSEKARELGAADVVVAPSRHEAFGASLLEIMAATAPLITSDAGGIPEVVKEYPLARVTARGSASDLRDALRSFIEGSWPDPTGNELASLPDCYAPKTVVGKLADVYRLALQAC